MFAIALDILLHDRVRFLITVLSLGIAITLAVWGSAVYFGTIDGYVNLIDRARADLWVIEKDYKTFNDPSQVPDHILHRAQAAAGVRYACPLDLMQAGLKIGANHPVQVVGIDPTCPLILPWDVVAGDSTRLREPGMIMVDDFVTRSDPTGIGDKVELNGHDAHIAAITHYNKAFFTPYVFASRRTFVRAGGTPDHSSLIAIQLAAGAGREQVSQALTSGEADIAVYTGAQLRAATAAWLTANGMGAGIGTMVLVGLLASLLIVTLTVYTATMERLRQFATLKAIGADNGELRKLILALALIQAAVSYAWAVVLSLGLNEALSRYVGMTGAFVLPAAAALFLFTMALAGLGALISVRKVLLVDPMLVFRA